MLKGLLGKGPQTTDIAAINFILSSPADLSTVTEQTYQNSIMAATMMGVAVRFSKSGVSERDKNAADLLWNQAMQMHESHLVVNIVTEKAGFPYDRLLCLVYLLCVEHQMKTYSSAFKYRFLNELQIVNTFPTAWESHPDKGVSGIATYQILIINVSVKQRHTPFITFHPKLLSRFPGGIENAILEFLIFYQLYLTEKVNATDLIYTRDGLLSLIDYWKQIGLPNTGSRTPRLPFLSNWQQ